MTQTKEYYEALIRKSVYGAFGSVVATDITLNGVKIPDFSIDAHGTITFKEES